MSFRAGRSSFTRSMMERRPRPLVGRRMGRRPPRGVAVVVLVTLLVVVGPVGGDVAGAAPTPPEDERPHVGPPWLYPPLLTEVETNEITLEYPGPRLEPSRPFSTLDGIYGGWWEDPSYVVALRFVHGDDSDDEIHADISGDAYRVEYDDEFDYDPRGKDIPGYEPRGAAYPHKKRHRLFLKEDGIGGDVIINEFDHPDGGWEGVDGPGGVRGAAGTASRYERFLLAGPDGYAHVHCAPTEPMTVSVLIMESDDESNIAAAATAAGAAVSIATGLTTGGAPIVVLGTTGASVVVSEAINAHFENEDDVIGVGHGSLNHNGQTTIDVLAAEWTDDGQLRVHTDETRGYVTFDARTRTMEEVLESWAARPGAVDSVPPTFDYEHMKKCNEGSAVPPWWTEGRVGGGGRTGTVTPTDGGGDGEADGQPTDEEAAYFESFESGLRLAMRLEAEGLPVGSVPTDQRRLVTGGVNVHVGSAGLGFAFDESGRLTRTTPVGLEDPALTVEMAPAVATDLAYAPDLESAILAGVERGEIRVSGNGARNRALVGTAKAALATRRFSRSISRRLSYVLPSRYTIDAGTSARIGHGGRSVTLRRNALGARVIDPGRDRVVLDVVDRAGTGVGVTTRGAQRLIAAETPSGWETFSGPRAGVYGRQGTLQARQAAAYEAAQEARSARAAGSARAIRAVRGAGR